MQRLHIGVGGRLVPLDGEVVERAAFERLYAYNRSI